LKEQKQGTTTTKHRATRWANENRTQTWRWTHCTMNYDDGESRGAK